MARNVFIDLIGRDRASRAFLTAAGNAERAAGKMSAANAKMARGGAVLTRGVTLPVLAIGAVSLKTASDFQKSMTLIQTAGGESAQKTKQISEGITKVATKTGTTLGDLADGMYIVAKAGSQKWSAAEQLNVLQAAAEGAKSENVDLGVATNALTSVMMSYHMSADQAVAAQNMIIVGAGRAKTTMAQYAGALSTVVPIASAVGIGFAEVAGGIATMTQHGTTADEATQELSHTIRNLASPNQVAVKAMSQLDLSVQDVTKNLGKRGLRGTIGLITDAIGKHLGPGGMVVVDAFKKSQSATQDLNTELNHMPKSLQDISSKFLSGKMSYKTYLADVKDLGGQQYVLGKNFISTVQQAKGFNDLLRSGSPQARTFAGTLKQVLGTATSMNTALQLGGDNASYFAETTKDVKKAAHDANGDVLNWGKTSSTFAFKIDKAKASLQVLALEIGQALIPAISSIVDWVSKAAHWFDGLSGTQKKVLAWSVGIVAALGPLLSIQARLATVAGGVGRFAGGIGTTLGRLAGATENTQKRLATASRGITAGIAGIGVGLAVGTMTKDASTTTKWLGALASAATGAAIGYSIGNVPGAIVGGILGAVSSLATSFDIMGEHATAAGDLAKQALATQNNTALTLLDTLKSVNGAYGESTRVQTANLLQKTPIAGEGSPNVLVGASKLGIDPRDLVKAALGDEKVLGRVQTKILSFAGTTKDALAGQVLQALSAVAQGAGMGEKQWELYNRATGKTIVGAKGLAAALAGQGNSLVSENKLAGQASASQERATAAISEVARSNRDAALAELAHGKSLKSVTGSLGSMNGAIKFTTNNLGFNTGAVQELINKYRLTPKQIVTTIKANTKPGEQTADRFRAVINNIRQNKIPGLTANSGPGRSIIQMMQAYIDNLRQNHEPTINVDAGNAISQIDAVNRYLNGLQSRTIYVNVAHRVLGAPVAEATGGLIRGPGTGTSDSILARVSDHEFVVRASQARKHLGLLNRINTPGYATGGKVDTSKIGSAIGVIGQAYTKPIDLASVGNARIRDQIANAIAVLNHQISLGLKAASAASFRAEITSLTKEADAQLADLKHKIATTDVAALTAALKTSTADTMRALQTLLTDAYHAGASSLVIKKIRGEETKLLSLQKQRLAVTAKLAEVQQKWTDAFQAAKAGTSGSFDITTAGKSVYNDQGGATVSGTLTTVRKAFADAQKFASALHGLVKAGVNPTLVAQLAAAGPQALPEAQALAAATPAEINSLNWNYSKVQQASKYIGGLVADDMYNTGAQGGQGLLDGLKSKQSALNHAVTNIANGMIAALKVTLKIKSPSKVMRGIGHHTADGYRLGLVDRMSHVQRAAKDLGNAAVPGAQTTSWRRTENRGGNTFHIYETHDAGATAMAVLRRERLAGYGTA